MTARLATKNPHDRPLGGLMCWKMCCPVSHGAPMNSGNWFARLVTSIARHIPNASSTVTGPSGEKKTSATGLTTALLPSARSRSENMPVLERPSVTAANRLLVFP